MVIETDYVHRNLDSLQEALRAAEVAHEERVCRMQESIRAERMRVAEHEKEEESLRVKLACALDMLKALGVANL